MKCLRFLIATSIWLSVTSLRLSFFKFSPFAKCDSRSSLGSSTESPQSDANVETTIAAAKVYKPRPDFVRPSDKQGRPPSDNKQKDAYILLENPQLLIRYRIPRVKSELKLQLESLQESYRQQTQQQYQSQQQQRPQSSGKFSFLDNTGPSFSPGDDKKPMTGRGKSAYSKKGDERPAPKKETKDKKSRDEDDVNDDSDDNYSDTTEEYYGDDEIFDLSIVPPSSLSNMEMEGYSLEEIQLSIYGEYGIKASIGAIKNKMRDDARERKSKGKTGKTRRDRMKAKIARKNGPDSNIVKLPEGPIQVAMLAELLDISAGDIVRHLMMNMGIMTTMTQNVEEPIAKEIVLAFGYVLGESIDSTTPTPLEEEEKRNAIGDSDLESVSRSPIVTIMGHVDHGKTTLLDSIRKTQVALGEAGGITQGMTAFKVNTKADKDVTFIDTPGHAAFSEMRIRGANVTDIVILVVAADDGIMEQTKECIAAARTAGCPIVVAINKVDKEGANPQNILTDLMKYDLLTEDFGGDVQCALISAKKGTGIDDLLDKVLVQADIMNLRTPISCNAEGTVLDARVDKGQGVVVTGLVQQGTLRIGDYVLAGPSWGRVRRILSDQNKDLKSAGPSTPVQIVGLSSVPNAGDVFSVCEDESSAKEVAEARQRLSRLATGSISNAAIKAQALSFADGSIDNREVLKIPVLIRGDVSGSVEALKSELEGLVESDEETVCKIDIVCSGVGPVTSSDVAIAAVSKAKILAFNVAAGGVAVNDARSSNVEIGYYTIIYELLEEMQKAIKSTLSPPPPGNFVGRAEIKKIFKGKGGKIAGCLVTEGVLRSDSQVRILRGSRNPVYTGTLSSIRIVKDVVTEVPGGSECGISFDKFDDFEEGDIVECFVSDGIISDDSKNS